MSESRTDRDFFLIHAGADAALARQLYDLLAVRHRVFLDQTGISPGDQWQVTLDEALKSTRVFVVLVTKQIGHSFYSNAEIATAVALHRRDPERRKIVPVIFGDAADAVERMPYDLRGVQGLFVDAGGDLREVADRLGALADRLAGAAAPSPEGRPAPAAGHVLLQFPPAPMIQSSDIPYSLKKAYADRIRVREARQVVDDANAFRREADPGTKFIIDHAKLISPEDQSPISYWIDAFGEAGRQGPRMLAALVLVVPDDLFPADARRDRQRLLTYLRNPPQ